MERAVFVDRDGVISEEVGYLGDRDHLRLIPHSAEAVKLVNQSGLKIIAITNQSGVARGYFSEEMLGHIHRKMEERRMKSTMILQVHDELVFEVPDAETEAMRDLACEVMTSAVALDVPLKVDTKVGRNWAEMK